MPVPTSPYLTLSVTRPFRFYDNDVFFHDGKRIASADRIRVSHRVRIDEPRLRATTEP
jgi:hypothetical protein